MNDNELLVSLSNMLDQKLEEKFNSKLQPIQDDIHSLKVDVSELKDDVLCLKLENENVIHSGIQLLVENYVRLPNIDIMKKVITNHSKQLQQIS